ncbi:MAG: hypothetical protein ACE3L7_33310 [Candidatus Pristimantibacillus sp.]
MEQLYLFDLHSTDSKSDEKVILPRIPEITGEVREVINQLKEAYADPSNNRPWCIATSWGKDSTLLSICVWVALLETDPEKRTRKVFFISSDTGLEHPRLTEYVRKTIGILNEKAVEQGLSCVEGRLVKPRKKDSFACKVVGKGMILPTPKSPFRWCTDAWKIAPAERFIKELMHRYGSVCVMTGVRSAESIKRATSIKKHGSSELVYPKIGKNKIVNGRVVSTFISGRYESQPIAHIQDADLWEVLMKFSKFPWGGRFYEMYSFYSDQGECPMQTEMKASCGSNSRNGCIFCGFHKEDSMLAYFREQNESWAHPISELKKIIHATLFDANFREPIRRRRVKKLDTFNSLSNRLYDDLDQGTLFDLDKHREPICIGGLPVNPDLAMGSLTLEGRIFLLKNILYYQKLAGIEIISSDELEEIQVMWAEDGWIRNEHDIKPEKLFYRGPLVLYPDYTLNAKETHIIDEGFSSTESKVFWITEEFGGGEQEIWAHLEKSKRIKGYAIPFYWQPILHNNEYWNNVVFVVCKPGIRTLDQARSFVDEFISCVANERVTEQMNRPLMYWNLQTNSKLQNQYLSELLYRGESPENIPLDTIVYSGLDHGLFQISHTIKSFSALSGIRYRNFSEVKLQCENSRHWHKYYEILLNRFHQNEDKALFLMDRGYHHLLIPNEVKTALGLSDLQLYLNYHAKFYGSNFEYILIKGETFDNHELSLTLREEIRTIISKCLITAVDSSNIEE